MKASAPGLQVGIFATLMLLAPAATAATFSAPPRPAPAERPFLLAHDCHRSIQYGEMEEGGEALWHFHGPDCQAIPAADQEPPPTAGGPGEPPPPAPPGLRPQMPKLDADEIELPPRS